MSSFRTTTEALAGVFLAGPLEANAMVDRASRLLGKRWRWLSPLAKRIASEFHSQSRPRVAVLVQFLKRDQGYYRACQKYDFLQEFELASWLTGPPEMVPIEAALAWDLPPLCTTQELADWLEVTGDELAWFADTKHFEQKHRNNRARHYRYRPLTKRRGSIRLIEAPKPRLKAIQRQILTEILDRMPPHQAAHGFRLGRSIRTFAQPHVDRQIVLKLDVQDFFPGIAVARVQAMFRAVGYPEKVADTLAGLCTNATPMDAWDKVSDLVPAREMRETRWLYAKPHLTQGAPTSPAIANLCAYRLDCRLTGLAAAAGANYTRYADDLAFSGDADFARVAHRFHLHVAATVMEEGFRVHYRKTRLMRRGVCQRLAGLVVNEHLNIPRSDYDRLKATLTNCIRNGATSQNHDDHEDFRSHLHGRICFVESVNPSRGRKLRELFERIEW